VTGIVLQIMLSLSGTRSSLSSVALISLAIALISSALLYALSVSLLHPIPLGLSFLVMFGLIHLLTDVRKWTTALGMTLAARLVTLGLVWLAMAGIGALGL